MAVSVTLANSLWALSSRKSDRGFRAAISDVEGAQSAYLMSLLQKNARSEYGTRYAFSSLRSVPDYRSSVPVTDYEDYVPFVDRISRGRGSVLTNEDVRLFEPTSGTTSGTKFIPYTDSLRSEFQHAIGPWVHSLFQEWPDLVGLRSYWSVSPPGAVPDRLGALKVGFEDDTEYLSALGRWVMGRVSAVPSSVAGAGDMHEFRVRTLSHLLAARDLGLVSVWNPTFLTILLDFFIEHSGEVLALVSDDAPGRADEIESLLDPHEDIGAAFSRIWPRLRVVSCWTDGPSRRYSAMIPDYLPHAVIQGKGLLATEAFVSFPYVAGSDPVLAVSSHFFEFEESDGAGLRLAHEVEEGGVYSVVVTTGGGLYRYRLHDRVFITGRIGRAPTMRFQGKDNVVVDLFGEKLGLEHVAACLGSAFEARGLEPSFCMLAPDEPAPGQTCYTLYLSCGGLPATDAATLARELDGLLCSNFHYDHCRRLGQLAPLRVFLIEETERDPSDVFAETVAARGARLGDVKPTILEREKGWSERFAGRYAAGSPGAGA